MSDDSREPETLPSSPQPSPPPAAAGGGEGASALPHSVTPLSTRHSALSTVYLGLGSNLGDRAANLRAAVDGLTAGGVAILRQSSVYETAPVGVLDQPRFLNAVVEADTALPPLALLDVVKAVERAVGRRPGVRWGPRVVDIDILLYGEERVDEREPWLAIPHPELWRRLFVLVPLAELRPDLRDPAGMPIGQRIEWLRANMDQTVRACPGV